MAGQNGLFGGGVVQPMAPQAVPAMGGPSNVMPNGMSSGDVNMGGNVSVATGPIDTGLGAEALLVGQRPRITDAMGNPQGSQMFGVAPPIEGTAEAGGVLGGAPALAGITPEMGYIKSDIYQGPPLSQGPNELTAMEDPLQRIPMNAPNLAAPGVNKMPIDPGARPVL